MSRQERGRKRTCPECSARFFDFGQSPALCPQCGHGFEPEVVLKSRRSRPPADAAAPADAPAAPEPGDALSGGDDEEVTPERAAGSG